MHKVLCQNMRIWPLKGRGLGDVTIFEILWPLYVFGMTKDRKTSYLVHTLTMTCTSQCTTNWPLKWAWSGSRDRNLKFGTPSITFERKKLRTQNLVDTYTAWRLLSKYKNLTPKGAWRWSRDHFRNFGTPFIWDPLYIFGMTTDRNFIFGAHIDYHTC